MLLLGKTCVITVALQVVKINLRKEGLAPTRFSFLFLSKSDNLADPDEIWIGSHFQNEILSNVYSTVQITPDPT